MNIVIWFTEKSMPLTLCQWRISRNSIQAVVFIISARSSALSTGYRCLLAIFIRFIDVCCTSSSSSPSRAVSMGFPDSLSPAIRLYRPPPSAGPLDNILCVYRAAVDIFEPVVQHLLVCGKESTREHHL